MTALADLCDGVLRGHPSRSRRIRRRHASSRTQVQVEQDRGAGKQQPGHDDCALGSARPVRPQAQRRRLHVGHEAGHQGHGEWHTGGANSTETC